jgi:single-strand DNA-binding protein
MSGFQINRVTLTGNLTRDPELRATPSGQPVASLRIAHNDRRKQGEQWVDVPGYYDVTVWGGLGEYLASNLSKGQKIVADGQLRWREYEADGSTRQAIEIVADSVVPIPREAPTGQRESADHPSGQEDPIAF